MSPSRGSRSAPSQSKDQPADQKRQPPVWSRKAPASGGAKVEVAVFERIVNEGEEGEFRAFSISCKRSWREGEGYRSASVFRGDDAPILAALLLMAYASLVEIQTQGKR